MQTVLTVKQQFVQSQTTIRIIEKTVKHFQQIERYYQTLQRVKKIYG